MKKDTFTPIDNNPEIHLNYRLRNALGEDGWGVMIVGHTKEMTAWGATEWTKDDLTSLLADFYASSGSL